LLWGGGRELKKSGPFRAFSRFLGSEPSLTALTKRGRGTKGGGAHGGGGGCFKIIMGIPGTISNMFRWFDEFLMNFDENLCKFFVNHVKFHGISCKNS
jgi:hypothetical protein